MNDYKIEIGKIETLLKQGDYDSLEKADDILEQIEACEPDIAEGVRKPINLNVLSAMYSDDGMSSSQTRYSAEALRNYILGRLNNLKNKIERIENDRALSQQAERKRAEEFELEKLKVEIEKKNSANNIEKEKEAVVDAFISKLADHDVKNNKIVCNILKYLFIVIFLIAFIYLIVWCVLNNVDNEHKIIKGFLGYSWIIDIGVLVVSGSFFSVLLSPLKGLFLKDKEHYIKKYQKYKK